MFQIRIVGGNGLGPCLKSMQGIQAVEKNDKRIEVNIFPSIMKYFFNVLSFLEKLKGWKRFAI